MKRSVKNEVDPYPCTARGETEFEEKRIEAEFELIFKRIADLCLSSIKDTHEYAFRAGYVTGKLWREIDAPRKLPSYIKIL